MSYISIPATVSKIQAENRLQREFLLKCEQQHPELGNTTVYRPSNAETFTRLPTSIWLPSLSGNKTPLRSALAQRKTNASSDTKATRQSLFTDSELSCHKTPSDIVTGEDQRSTTSTLCSARPQQAERLNKSRKSSLRLPTQWHLIPSHLRAYPSLFEQLIKLRNPLSTPVPTSAEWKNRFAPLFTKYYDNDFESDSTIEPLPMMS